MSTDNQLHTYSMLAITNQYLISKDCTALILYMLILTFILAFLSSSLCCFFGSLSTYSTVTMVTAMKRMKTSILVCNL